MFNWLTKSALGIVALSAVALSSCNKDEVRATLTPSNSPTLTASTSSVVLTQANASNTAVAFTWTPISSFAWSNASSTYQPSVAYQFQFDKKGNNFAAPATIDASAASPSSISVGDLDAALLTLGNAAGRAADYEVRLKATYASNAPLYSGVVPLTATTYVFCAQPAKGWSIIGPGGIDWNTDVTLQYNCDAKTYSYSGPMKVGDYKFRYNKDWTANLGGTNSAGGALTQDGPNLSISTAKNYTITLTPGTIDAAGKASGGSFTIQ